MSMNKTVIKSLIDAFRPFGVSIKETGDALREMGKLGISLPKRQEPESVHTSTTLRTNSPIPEVQAGINETLLLNMREYNGGIVLNKEKDGGIIFTKDKDTKPKKLQKTREVRCL